MRISIIFTAVLLSAALVAGGMSFQNEKTAQAASSTVDVTAQAAEDNLKTLLGVSAYGEMLKGVNINKDMTLSYSQLAFLADALLQEIKESNANVRIVSVRIEGLQNKVTATFSARVKLSKAAAMFTKGKRELSVNLSVPLTLNEGAVSVGNLHFSTADVRVNDRLLRMALRYLLGKDGGEVILKDTFVKAFNALGYASGFTSSGMAFKRV